MRSTIQKWGNSQAIRLPKAVLEMAHFGENEPVEIFAENDKIVIKRDAVQKRKTIQERFEGFEGEYIREEIDWGKPVGKEVW